MPRLHILIDGQAEAFFFVVWSLVPHLAVFDIAVTIGVLNIGADLEREMAHFADPEVWFTTIIDPDTLPTDFPGWEEAALIDDPLRRARMLETALRQKLPESQRNRFIPYVQAESLLPSDPDEGVAKNSLSLLRQRHPHINEWLTALESIRTWDEDVPEQWQNLPAEPAVAPRFDRLERLTVEGYKSIRALPDLVLQDLNIIIGPNGAGKSNLLGLFRFLASLARRELQLHVGQQAGAARLLHFGPGTTSRLHLSLQAQDGRYEADLVPSETDSLVFAREIVGFRGHEQAIGAPGQAETGLGRGASALRFPGIIRRSMEAWRVYHFHDTSADSPLRRHALLRGSSVLAANGANLPAVLYDLQERQPDALKEIEYHVRRVAPFFGGFTLRPQAGTDDVVRLRWRHRGSEEDFDARDFSDGTLRFICLVTLLLQPDPPPLIVVDEPELGLHPFALHLLAGLMHSIVPRSQIICTTQSVTLANQFSWENLIVVDRIDEASQFRRLDAGEVEAWLDEYSVGEMWEKNIIGGRPR